MKPTEGILINVSLDSNPGTGSVAGIDLKSNVKIFHHELPRMTVNIAEFIGVVLAIHYGSHPDVYSKSQTALSWIKNKKANTSFQKYGGKVEKISQWAINVMDDISIESDSEAIWINDGEMSVRKWITKEWGRIEAKL